MTLKVRNRLMQLFFIISLICIFTAICSFIIAFINKAITPPPAIRIPGFLNSISFFKYSFTATMIAIALFILYAPGTVAHLIPVFETTQTTEVIFFLGFLSGCLCEGVRFLTPLFGLWSTFSDFLFFCGRILFMGRILCPLSFVFAAIASSVEQRQDVERNLTFLFTIPIVFCVIVPLNTAKITSAGAVTWGFSNLFLAARIIFILIAFISYWINGEKSNTPEYKKLAVNMLILMTGYTFMICADNFIFLIIGFPLMLFGSAKYLSALHSLYMWK